ncbi:MAG: hypothetical protein WCS20_16135 [Alphaproteobacteria bacterium]|jgi:hypothetical protein
MEINLDNGFERTSRYYFWISGFATASLTWIPALLPVRGLALILGLSYYDQSPQIFPIVGHWGIMVFGIGILLIAAGRNKALRKASVIYAIVEKAYMVAVVAYLLAVRAPFAINYLPLGIADALMVAGGVWYLVQSRKRGQL